MTQLPPEYARVQGVSTLLPTAIEPSGVHDRPGAVRGADASGPLPLPGVTEDRGTSVFTSRGAGTSTPGTSGSPGSWMSSAGTTAASSAGSRVSGATGAGVHPGDSARR